MTGSFSLQACRTSLTDRVMAVRVAAADCLVEMLDSATFLHTQELDNLASLCFRALEGASTGARRSVARLLGLALAHTQDRDRGKARGMVGPGPRTAAPAKLTSLEEALGLLGQGFLRGGLGSFLKGTGDLMKSGGVSPEVRVGVSYSYVVMVRRLGPAFTERNLATILSHVLELASNAKAGSSHTETVSSRNCVTYILSSLLGRLLREKAQLSACKELLRILARSLSTGEREEAGEAGANTQHLQVRQKEIMQKRRAQN